MLLCLHGDATRVDEKIARRSHHLPSTLSTRPRFQCSTRTTSLHVRVAERRPYTWPTYRGTSKLRCIIPRFEATFPGSSDIHSPHPLFLDKSCECVYYAYEVRPYTWPTYRGTSKLRCILPRFEVSSPGSSNIHSPHVLLSDKSCECVYYAYEVPEMRVYLV